MKGGWRRALTFSVVFDMCTPYLYIVVPNFVRIGPSVDMATRSILNHLR